LCAGELNEPEERSWLSSLLRGDALAGIQLLTGRQNR